MYSLLPGRPRQRDIDALFSSATSIDVTDPEKSGVSAILATFVADDILALKAFLKIEEGNAPIVGSKVEILRFRFFQEERFLGEIRHFFSSISIPRWNSKCVVEQDEILDWLKTKGVIPPCSRLLPEWEAVVDKIHPG